jgi:hypothetical protein
MKRFFTILFTLHSSLFTLRAQDALPTVTASFDRDSVMIGDQFTLEVRVDKDMMQMVDFPALEDGIEVIS